MCPPKPKVEKAKLPDNIPEPSTNFKLNQGFKYGGSDNPPLYGQKPQPQGLAGCLAGYSFVPTGTMPSLRREQVKDLIEKYGGRVGSSISGRTDFVLRGCLEVGPKKLDDAKSKKVRIIDEDGLFYIINASRGIVSPPQPESSVPAPAGNSSPKSDAPATAISLKTDTDSKIVIPAARRVEIKMPALTPNSSLLTEKYRPLCFDDFIGNRGAVYQLKGWLTDFDKMKRRMAIIAGPPGCGKTTAAYLAAFDCGYTVTEFNASDTRSKSALMKIKSVVTTNSLQCSYNQKKSVVVFDEIDGMSVGDYGGLSFIIQLAKECTVPVICICNDTSDAKYDELNKIALAVGFMTPSEPEILKRLKYVCDEEKINISEDQLRKIIRESNYDYRFCINSLELWRGSDDANGKVIDLLDINTATIQLFDPNSSVDDKMSAYFSDYSRMPGYVHQNVRPKSFEDYADFCDYVSLGDTLTQEIRELQAYELLPAHSMIAAALPAMTCPRKLDAALCPLSAMQMQRERKLQRQIREITKRAYPSVPQAEIAQFILPLIARSMLWIANETDKEILDFLEELGLTLDDAEHAVELNEFTGVREHKLPDIKKEKMTSLTKLYRATHSDKLKKIVTSEKELREDHCYVLVKESKPPKVVKKPITRRVKK